MADASRTRGMRTTLFVPVRNEMVGVQQIMPQVDPKWVDEILVVDGHSTDGTGDWFRSRGIKVIEQKSKGICGAYWECVENATGDIIVAFSPDGNSLAEKIVPLVEKMKEGYDMVTVSRYLDGAKSEDDDWLTGLGNKLFTWFVNAFFGARCTDSLVMMRAFRKDLPYLLEIPDRDIPVFEYTLTIRAAKAGLKCADIPGDEPKRIGDVRKMKPFYNGSCLVWVSLRELFSWWWKPLSIRRANKK